MPITYCPPRHAHTLLPEEKSFVRSRFSQATEASYGRLTDGSLGWRSHGFDGRDFFSDDGSSAGMHVNTHKLEPHRRLDVPDWVRNPNKLAAVYVRQLEKRAFLHRPLNGTLPERLIFAHKCLEQNRAAQLTNLIDKLLSQEIELRMLPHRTELQEKQMRDLQQSIRGTDMELRCIRGEMLLNVVDLYWRQGWDAAAVGKELGISHGHVRQILCRLRRTAAELEHEQPTQTVEQAGEKIFGSKTKICAFCGSQFVSLHGSRKFCGRQCRRKYRRQQDAKRRLAFCSQMCKVKFTASGQGSKPAVGNFVSQFTTT